MTTMTAELRRAIQEAADSPPHFVDPETKVDYVLIRADVFDRIRALLEPDEGLNPQEMSALIWETMKGDWDDPRMDDYDHYPESQS